MKNIEKLIADHNKTFEGRRGTDLTADEMQQLYCIIMSNCDQDEQKLAKRGFYSNILFNSIVASWKAAYMAGYKRAQADAKAKPIKWQHLDFEDGSNPYIVKTAKELTRIKKKYAGRIEEVKPGFWIVKGGESGRA